MQWVHHNKARQGFYGNREILKRQNFKLCQQKQKDKFTILIAYSRKSTETTILFSYSFKNSANALLMSQAALSAPMAKVLAEINLVFLTTNSLLSLKPGLRMADTFSLIFLSGVSMVIRIFLFFDF